MGAQEYSGERHRSRLLRYHLTPSLCGADATRNRQILERIPAGRWGQPSELAGAAVFLASPAAD